MKQTLHKVPTMKWWAGHMRFLLSQSLEFSGKTDIRKYSCESAVKEKSRVQWNYISQENLNEPGRNGDGVGDAVQGGLPKEVTLSQDHNQKINRKKQNKIKQKTWGRASQVEGTWRP